ncbi:MAG TPA: hypothetical protein DCM05_12945 [Elusimicrobia bacterium]|nr:hypothetical protein [Elusimicrobiota bacterium]
MSYEALERYRKALVSNVRRLRLERRWTQARLARLLGVSQGWISDIERGRGSFTAEQLVAILAAFNADLDRLASCGQEGGARVQNALARLGASHLHARSDAIPSERVREASDAVREALAAADSPRLLTAVAPVLVENIDRVNLGQLRSQLLDLGLGQRLGWALECTLEALRRELAEGLPRDWALRYRRAEVLIKAFLSLEWPGRGAARGKDVLDGEIVSERSLEEVWADGSAQSREWGIVTRIQVDDFSQALRLARETH